MKLDRKPAAWEDHLALHLTHLVAIKKRRSKTIKSYSSAIKKILKREGIMIDENKYKLSALVNSCRLQNDELYVRLPIQKGLKNMILDQIEDYFLNRGKPYLVALHRALITTAYYGLLRVGEITLGTHPIFAANVHTAKNRRKFVMVLKTSKTHSSADLPQKITIISKEEIYRKQVLSLQNNS